MFLRPLARAAPHHPPRPTRPRLPARGELAAAARLLARLRDTGTDLRHARPDELADWRAAAPAHAQAVARSFLSWAARQHLTRLAPIALAPGAVPRTATDDEHRWELAHRHLHDDTIPVADRVAALLVLLYGQRAPTITGLTVEHVHVHVHVSGTEAHHEVRLALGHDLLMLPSPLAELITQLPATSPRGMSRSWPVSSPTTVGPAGCSPADTPTGRCTRAASCSG